MLTLEMLENVFTGRLVLLPRDEMERPRVILVIAGDLEKYKTGGVHFHTLNALIPSILSAVEIIEYVSDERRKVEMKKRSPDGESGSTHADAESRSGRSSEHSNSREILFRDRMRRRLVELLST